MGRKMRRGLLLVVLVGAAGAPAFAANRATEICQNPGDTRQTINAATVAATLRDLLGFMRHQALSCLEPRIQNNLTGADLARIVGIETDYRQRMLCTLKKHARPGLSADEVVMALGPISAFERHQALTCLEPQIKFADGLTAEELNTIVGASVAYRERMLCTLREHVRDSISARDVALALGTLSGAARHSALRCLEPKLADGLGDEDVDLIVGEERDYRGRMIATLDPKTLDGMHAATLQSFRERFPNRQFLGEGDPPGWLDGQCIAWARKLFGQVSQRSIEGVAFGRANRIPGLLRSAGFAVVDDPTRPRVGALIVWDEGVAGHVGVVTKVTRNAQSGAITGIVVSEANYGRVTAAGARKWGLSEERARAEFVTEKYGTFAESRFPVISLDRGVFRFSAYVYP